MVFKLQVFENVWRWLLPFTWNDHRNVHFELYDHGSAAAVNQTLRSPNIHYNRALVGAIETCTTSLLSRVYHGEPKVLGHQILTEKWYCKLHSKHTVGSYND